MLGCVAAAAATNYPMDKASLEVMAKQITLPEFKLDGVNFSVAVIALQKTSVRYDAKHRDVHFLVCNGAEAEARPSIAFDLKNVTLAEAMERLALSAGVRVTAKDYAFFFYADSDKL